ncbi:transposable element Tc1 transposase [Trichonephila clavipes]|nr:transposable element Tc1 transposase [Trichonephila clavipes]
MDFTEIKSSGKRGELLGCIDRQNYRFRTAKTIKINFGLHASFVELESAKNAVNEQGNARPHTARVFMNYLTAIEKLPWSTRSPDLSPIEHVWDIKGSRLYVPGNVDDLTRQLEKIWQEISQKTIKVLNQSMASRVAACIQARGGSTPC